MNIFFVDYDPCKAAQALCNKHVIKQVLESAQMLSTAQHVMGYGMDSSESDFYSKTHMNHLCNKWIRESYQNYKWLLTHAISLCTEYTFRYNKQHKSSIVIFAACNFPLGFDYTNHVLTPPAQAMPDEYKDTDPVKAYRRYYIEDKMKNIDCRWTKRPKPEWINES